MGLNGFQNWEDFSKRGIYEWWAVRLLQNCQLSDYSLCRIESHLGFQLFKHPLVCYITCEHYIYLTDNISVELLGKKKDHKKCSFN